MTVTIKVKARNDIKDIVIFQWDMTLEQIQELNNFANQLVEGNE